MNLSAKHTKLRITLLLLIMLVAASFRLTVVLGTEIEAPLRADAGQYFAYAYNLVNHGVYSNDFSTVGGTTMPKADNLRNPGYPLFLIPFATDNPTQLTILEITLAQAALSLLGVFVVYVLALRCLSWPLALGVTTLTAISPHLLNMNVYVLSETTASFALMLFLCWFVHCNRNVGWHAWLLAGALLGIATLVRPTVQWLLVPMLLAAWFLRRPSFGRITAGLVLGFLLAMGPWWARNAHIVETDEPSLMVGTIHHGMYPGMMFDNDPQTFGYPYRFDPRSDEISRDLGSVGSEVLRRFREEPVEHARWYLVGKPIMFWSWNNDAQGSGDVFIYPPIETPFASDLSLIAAHRLMHWLHWPLVALGLVGALLCWSPMAARVLTREQVWGLRVCALTLLYYVAVHIVAAPFPRYSIPVLPLLYLMAMGTIEIFRRLRARDSKSFDTEADTPESSAN